MNSDKLVQFFFTVWPVVTYFIGMYGGRQMERSAQRQREAEANKEPTP